VPSQLFARQPSHIKIPSGASDSSSAAAAVSGSGHWPPKTGIVPAYAFEPNAAAGAAAAADQARGGPASQAGYSTLDRSTAAPKLPPMLPAPPATSADWPAPGGCPTTLGAASFGSARPPLEPQGGGFADARSDSQGSLGGGSGFGGFFEEGAAVGKTCVQCARAKVKCDKVAPVCGRCARLGSPCHSQARGPGRPPNLRASPQRHGPTKFYSDPCSDDEGRDEAAPPPAAAPAAASAAASAGGVAAGGILAQAYLLLGRGEYAAAHQLLQANPQVALQAANESAAAAAGLEGLMGARNPGLNQGFSLGASPAGPGGPGFAFLGPGMGLVGSPLNQAPRAQEPRTAMPPPRHDPQAQSPPQWQPQPEPPAEPTLATSAPAVAAATCDLAVAPPSSLGAASVSAHSVRDAPPSSHPSEACRVEASVVVPPTAPLSAGGACPRSGAAAVAMVGHSAPQTKHDGEGPIRVRGAGGESAGESLVESLVESLGESAGESLGERAGESLGESAGDDQLEGPTKEDLVTAHRAYLPPTTETLGLAALSQNATSAPERHPSGLGQERDSP